MLAAEDFANMTISLAPKQEKILNFLEDAAHHLLEKGEHVPVRAFVMRDSEKIELVELDQSFAHQEDALTATLQKLIPMARAGEIQASGIVFQPGDPGKEKPNVLIFDVEQIGCPRIFATLTYRREDGNLIFGSKTIDAAPARLLA